jgi:hypothetical protein
MSESIKALLILVPKLIDAIELADARNEGDTFGILHNEIWDSVAKAQALLARINEETKQ